MHYEDKYLERLASVYLDKYEKSGYVEAKKWYDGFLPEDLKLLVKPFVEREVKRRQDNKNNGKNKEGK